MHVWLFLLRFCSLLSILSMTLVGLVVCVYCCDLQLKPLIAIIGQNSPDTTFNLSAVSR